MAPQSLPHEPPLSEVLRELTREPGRDIPINELVERFGSRAFGALLFVFSVACALPLPPGGSTVFGAPLVLLAPQLALGFRSPWLPRGMRHRRIRGADLKRVADRLIPWLCRIERVSRPRLGPMFGGPAPG